MATCHAINLLLFIAFDSNWSTHKVIVHTHKSNQSSVIYPQAFARNDHTLNIT